MEKREAVRRAFARPVGFSTSPLYRALCATVAAEDRLLDLAAGGRPGQYPTFLFFGAVHQLLLNGADHPLARYYPSVVGSRAEPPEGAGAHLVDFCARYADELAASIGTRLVQTNQVGRALGLRFGLSVIAPDVKGPIHLIEVGTSAGLNLRFDRYGYRLAGRAFGDGASQVQLAADLYGTGALPDLDEIPELASVRGVDLDPVDVADPDARSWLEALVWPENTDQRGLLARAMALVAADPPPIIQGDAIDVLPRLAGGIPAGEPRVVFHAATRMHIPPDRVAAFDAAIASLGETGPLWWISVEDVPRPDPRPQPRRLGVGLELRTPDGERRTLAVVEGHLRWIETLGG